MILGIILRLFTAAYAYHTDTKAIYHETLAANQNLTQAYHSFFDAGSPMNYPPLVYKTLGTYYKIAKPLFSNYFVTWMSDWSAKNTLSHPHIFRDLLAMKLPYLIFDLAIAWLLTKIVSEKNRNLILGLWILNPMVIWSIYVPGNFDIFPAFLSVLAVLCWQKDKKWITYLLLGLAAGYKLYPLLLLFGIIFIDDRPVSKRLRDFILGLLVFASTLIPILRDTWILKFILGTNLSTSLFKASVDIGLGAQIPIYLSLYFGLMIWLSFNKNKISPQVLFSVLLIVLLSLVRFHQQWIIWVLPFISLVAVEDIFSPYLLPVFGGAYFGSILLTNDKFTNFGVMKAVNNAFDTIDPLRIYADKFGLGSSLYAAFLALFIAVALYISWMLLTDHHKGINFDKFWHGILRPLGASLVIVPVLIFLTSHILLLKYGKYIDVENKGSDASIVLGKTVVIKQSMKVESSNFSAIEMSLKNVDLKSKDIINWTLESKGIQKAQGNINGAAVGDDFDMTVYFPVISDSKGETYTLTLTSPQATPGREIMIPYYATSESARMVVNGKPIGNMSYTTYFNPGGYLNNLKYTLINMLSKW